MSQEPQEVPRVLGLLWGRAEPMRRGPRPALTIEEIGRAAIAVADAEGLDAVSMKRVAQACGVSTMALYRYVDTKADLFTLMLEFASDAPPQITAEDWRAGLEQWCRAYRSLLVAHPWVLQVPLEGPPETPFQLGWMETALVAMRDMGLSPKEQTQVLLQVNVYVRGDVGLNAELPTDQAEAGTWATRMLALIDSDEFPAVHAMIKTGEFDDDDDPVEQFEFGLARTLDGIAILVEERRG